MDFAFTQQEEQFRKEIIRFLSKELPQHEYAKMTEMTDDERWAFTRSFSKKLAKQGWLALAWPKEYGGQGRSPIEQTIYREAMAYHQFPPPSPGAPWDLPLHMAVSWVGPSLMLHGTEAQKQAFLPKICNAELGFCTLYSEPQAGSDLAAIQCKAAEDGDDYVINGEKIWTSGGHRADFGWLAARTDPDAPKHKGMSIFIVDMRSPGVEVRPLVNMVGEHKDHDFNQVFFDNVRIPKRNMVGAPNTGWYLLAVALDFERSGIYRVAEGKRCLEELAEYLQSHLRGTVSVSRQTTWKHRLADLMMETNIARLLAYRISWMQTKGLIPNKEASESKLFGSELEQKIANTGMQLLGLHGQLHEESRHAPLKGHIERAYLSTVMATIGAGTSEIQRNIIATRGLGLPRV